MTGLDDNSDGITPYSPGRNVSGVVRRKWGVESHRSDGGAIPLSSDARQYLRLVFENKRYLLLSAFIALLISTLYVLSSDKVYRSNALLRLEGESSFLETLLEKGRTGLSQVHLAKEENRILQSRAILGPVVDSLDLAVEVEPVYFPLFGRLAGAFPVLPSLISHLYPDNGYAWKGDQVVVRSLDIPESMQGRRLTLVVEDNGRFTLLDGKKKLVEHAPIGQKVALATSAGTGYSIEVDSLQAAAGAHFNLSRVPRTIAIGKLRNSLSIDARDAGTRVIELAVTGKAPEKIAEILNDIIKTYRKLRLSWSSSEAHQELKFLGSRLPLAKAELEEAENALADYQKKHRSIDISVEAEELIRKSSALEMRLRDLKLERDLMVRQYTSQYPDVAKIGSRIAAMTASLATLKSRRSALPGVSNKLQSLKRDLEMRSQLYTSLQDRFEKQRVAEASSIGSVRLIDGAVTPGKPIWPKASIVLPLGVLGVLFLHLLYLFVRAAFSNQINNAETVENRVGLPVYLDIPHSAKERQLPIHPRNWLPSQEEKPVLALSHPNDFAVETLRSLRTMLGNILTGLNNPVLMICGPLPKMGKTFVSANLAALLAEAGKKVLLIDGDYYRGHLHRLLRVEATPGLTDVLAGHVTIKAAIKSTTMKGLDLIPRGGDGLPNDVQLDAGLSRIISVLKENYDYILIDAPPVLSLSASAVIGKIADASIMVVRAQGVTTDEMKAALNRLNLAGVNVNGCLVNNVRKQSPGYAYRTQYSEVNR